MKSFQTIIIALVTLVSILIFQPSNSLFLPATAQETTELRAKRWTDSAKFMAGIPVEKNSYLEELQKNSNWPAHSNYLNEAWSTLDTQQLAKVRNWATTELKEINATKPLIFYPFSGPDFLYAYSFFPQGREYILVGLEPIGGLPPFQELSIAETNQKLEEIRGSLQAILEWSFFRTNDMRVDLAQQGVLPIILLFMARTNNEILDVKYVGLDESAKIQDLETGMIPGVKITFRPQGESTERILYYFSTDLSDEGLATNPQFASMVEDLDAPITYLKAASYLMHYDYFSQIRNLILDSSQNLLQDDSGIPLKYFDPNTWDLSFHGTYTAPISLFDNMYQADLKQVYDSGQNIKPLDFGVGYKFGLNESNLMLAKRKS